MPSNSFGNVFRITTWGESHGKAVGVVIDGCPAGLSISEEDIGVDMKRRAGGQSSYVTPRKEKDQPHILSGVFEGKTTGAPISIIFWNEDVDSSKYEPIKNILRPGHANFTYLEKYGHFDYRGSGRASARETTGRVAAGTIAKKLLARNGIECTAYIHTIGSISVQSVDRAAIQHSLIFSPDPTVEKYMLAALDAMKMEGDSLGGIVECVCENVPAGLGDPVYEKLPANLAKAMLSIPATKGFEIGEGFGAARMRGSEHNDAFAIGQTGKPSLTTNTAGGTLGGISTGQDIRFRVAFKPTSSIAKPQPSVTTTGEAVTLELPAGSRHDPCVAIRAVPVVEAMAAIAIADALLMSRLSKV